MILNDVPLVEIEEKTMNGNIFSKECCIQMIKDIINKDIGGTIHYIGDEETSNKCLTISNPYVKVVEKDFDDEEKQIITLFCSVEIDESKTYDNILDILSNNLFRLYPVGIGTIDDDVIKDFELMEANIEIAKKI